MNWRIAAAMAVFLAFGGLVAATHFNGGSGREGVAENVSDVELAGNRSFRRVPACRAWMQARANSARYTKRAGKTGSYTDSDGATQHHGDGQVSVAALRRQCRDQVAGRPTQGQPGGGDQGGNNGGNNGGQPGDGGGNDGGNNGGQPGDGGGNDGGGNDGGQQPPPDNGGQQPPPDDGGGQQPPPNNGLEILGNNCEGSQLEPHDGFQNGNRCVSTAHGEVASEGNNPQLLIVGAPEQVGVGEAFEIQVSTRNLVRDRFLAAGQGGYYLESGFLNEQGLTRGHFHTACRLIGDGNEAPPSADVPAFFVATEDGGGGAQPDTVSIQVPGINQAGQVQCSSWAGDGSHRVPLMQRANQTPAFDSVRVQVG